MLWTEIPKKITLAMFFDIWEDTNTKKVNYIQIKSVYEKEELYNVQLYPLPYRLLIKMLTEISV